MAKQIYNYELFTNKKESCKKSKDKDIAAGVDLSGSSDSRLYSF